MQYNFTFCTILYTYTTPKFSSYSKHTKTFELRINLVDICARSLCFSLLLCSFFISELRFVYRPTSIYEFVISLFWKHKMSSIRITPAFISICTVIRENNEWTYTGRWRLTCYWSKLIMFTLKYVIRLTYDVVSLRQNNK